MPSIFAAQTPALERRNVAQDDLETKSMETKSLAQRHNWVGRINRNPPVMGKLECHGSCRPDFRFKEGKALVDAHLKARG